MTARRREEALQDAPISITAVSGDALTQCGVTDALSFQSRVPSLSLANQGTTRNELGFAIRGQRTQESQLLTDPPVGTYFAEQQNRGRYNFASGAGTGGALDAYGVEPFERLKNYGITNRTKMDLDDVPAYLITSNRYRNIEQYSEDFQGQGKALGDKLDYILGVYYFIDKGKDGSTSSQFPELALISSGLPLAALLLGEASIGTK